MQTNRKMPQGFFWGNSVSSMQTEGAWNIGGKGLSVYDVRPADENSSDWHVAIDEYHRYEEDLDLMAEMNMNMYRIQISWSRVNPQGDGEFNEEGIAFYDRLVDAMLKRGIEPMICLYHFDMPLNLAKNDNGFMSRHVVDAFVRYGKKMIEHFSDRVKYWITFNEHNLYFGDGAFLIAGCENVEKSLDNLYKIFHHTMLAHAELDAFVHENYDDVKFGGMLAYTPTYPAASRPKDVFLADRATEFLIYNLCDLFANGHYSLAVEHFIKENKLDMDFLESDREILSKMKADFLAFSYYRTDVLDSTKVPDGTAPNRYLNFGYVENEYLEANEWGWQIDPLGFREAIDTLYFRYQLPIFPIENGIGIREQWDGEHEIQDDKRIEYHRDHIKAMKDAMFEDGAKVMGYLGWGLIDIPSSHGDMEKRYGAVYVNRSNHDLKDLRRIPKKSVHWFKKIFKDNGDEL